jgi:hypothetical protein
MNARQTRIELLPYPDNKPSIGIILSSAKRARRPRPGILAERFAQVEIETVFITSGWESNVSIRAMHF